MNFLLRNFDIIFVVFDLATCVVLLLLYSIHRKVNRMSPAMEALTTKITALQASVDALKARLAAPAAAPAPVEDDADIVAAQAVVDSLKTEVDSLVPAAG